MAGVHATIFVWLMFTYSTVHSTVQYSTVQYSISGPETRHIPLHSNRDMLGINAKIQIILGQCI